MRSNLQIEGRSAEEVELLYNEWLESSRVFSGKKIPAVDWHKTEALYLATIDESPLAMAEWLEEVGAAVAEK